MGIVPSTSARTICEARTETLARSRLDTLPAVAAMLWGVHLPVARGVVRAVRLAGGRPEAGDPRRVRRRPNVTGNLGRGFPVTFGSHTDPNVTANPLETFDVTLWPAPAPERLARCVAPGPVSSCVFGDSDRPVPPIDAPAVTARITPPVSRQGSPAPPAAEPPTRRDCPNNIGATAGGPHRLVAAVLIATLRPGLSGSCAASQ